MIALAGLAWSRAGCVLKHLLQVPPCMLLGQEDFAFTSTQALEGVQWGAALCSSLTLGPQRSELG